MVDDDRAAYTIARQHGRSISRVHHPLLVILLLGRQIVGGNTVSSLSLIHI